ncbi:Alpha,alpha-trehalose phosphorylase [compost metagenome]
MVNAVDWLYTRIIADGEIFDMAASAFSNFRRELDFRSGIYKRELVWHLANDKRLKLTFERIVSMRISNLGCQRITFEPLNFSGTIRVIARLDFAVLHEDQGRMYWEAVRCGEQNGNTAMLGRTVQTKNRLFSGFRLEATDVVEDTAATGGTDCDWRFIGRELLLSLKQGQRTVMDKLTVNMAEKT